MHEVKMDKLENFSKDFVPAHLRSEKDDFYHLRNSQSDSSKFRALSAKETEILVKNNNSAEDWDKVLVSENFDPSLVRNCTFWGLIRIGDLERNFLEFHKLRMPVGLTNSTIVSCDIGDNVAINNVHYLSHYIIDNRCILFNIDEMLTVDNAKFGNGIVKEGEEEEVRIWLELANENGGRKVLPFEGMLPADAYIWSRYREDTILMQRFKEFTDRLGDTRRGFYGHVGEQCVIKDSRIIKDCRIGTHTYIKGANKLKNLTIQSNQNEATQIGEGVELVNGIIGYCNRIFYGVKAVRFVTGRNVQLKYGARLINSLLGANSTISCCEVLNNLIFPFHEQHHNNSFLIASTIKGQSNIAAGATIGSNHNSRAADGEIIAERGFWPGLVTNFKHNSYFAPFTLAAKGNYNAELNIDLPFSLVSPGERASQINVYPAYWFKYNMYALARNAWKFHKRDKRVKVEQHIEHSYLAPDTIESMFHGIARLKTMVEKHNGQTLKNEAILNGSAVEAEGAVIATDLMYKGEAVIRKPLQGIRLYRQMIHYYGVRALVQELTEILNNKEQTKTHWLNRLKRMFIEVERNWENIGGQLIPQNQLEILLDKIRSNEIDSWQALHSHYAKLWRQYPKMQRQHGLECLLRLYNIDRNMIDEEQINAFIQEYRKTTIEINDRIFRTREKDYSNPFRKITYRNDDEMIAVMGAPGENGFISEHNDMTEQHLREIDRILNQITQD